MSTAIQGLLSLGLLILLAAWWLGDVVSDWLERWANNHEDTQP